MSDNALVPNGGNGAVLTAIPPPVLAPFAVGPGTDFKAVAIGVGANLEGLPAYFVDPLLGTGNMPGIAISSFNNRALRQGTFVASSLCQWISGQLNLYIPDDGNQINWISEWQNALAAFVAALIPAGPDLGAYLPLAGGQMVGNIRFQSGISTILENNTWYYGRDTGGQARGLILKGNDNNVYVNDGSATLVRINGTPVANNNLSWSGRDTGGLTRSLIGLLSDNDLHIGSSLTTNIRFDVTGTVFHLGNIALANNHYVNGIDTGGTARAMLGIGTANQMLIASGAQATTDIYGPTGIGLRHNTTAYALFQVNGYTYLNGGARSYIPGGNDPHQIYADNGFYARHHYIVGGTRDWTCGCMSGGTFGIADESAHAVRFQINLDGLCVANSGFWVNGTTWLGVVSVGNGLTVYNGLNVASGNVSFAGSLTSCWDAWFGGSIFVGGLQVYNNSGWLYSVNGIQADTIYSRSNLNCPGQVHANNGYIDAGFTAAGNILTNYFKSNGAVDAGHVYSFDYVHADNYINCNNYLDVGGPSYLRGGFQAYGNSYSWGDIWGYSVSPWENNNRYCGMCSHQWWAVFSVNFATESDPAIKRDITPMPEVCLDLVNSIRPATFKYADHVGALPEHPGADPEQHPLKAQTHWGFMYPDVVRAVEERDLDFAGAFEDMGAGFLCYQELTAVLWQAVRELSDEVSKLKASLN